MKEIKIFIRTDKKGSECEDVIFVADNVTDDEIFEYAKNVAFNFIDWGYEILSDTKDVDMDKFMTVFGIKDIKELSFESAGKAVMMLQKKDNK